MRIKASTLIESIIALLLISIAFGISIITYVSVLNGGNLNQKQAVHHIIKSIAIDTKTSQKFVDVAIERDSITYTQTIQKINPKGLLKLNIRAQNNRGRTIEEYNEFIITNDQN